MFTKISLLACRHDGTIMNFKITHNPQTGVCNISKKSFASLGELLKGYSTHPLKSKVKGVGIYLTNPIPFNEAAPLSPNNVGTYEHVCRLLWQSHDNHIVVK